MKPYGTALYGINFINTNKEVKDILRAIVDNIYYPLDSKNKDGVDALKSRIETDIKELLNILESMREADFMIDNDMTVTVLKYLCYLIDTTLKDFVKDNNLKSPYKVGGGPFGVLHND